MTVQHNGTTDPNEGRLNAKEIYAPLVELVIHGQDNAYSGASRSRVRSHPDQQSEVMPITVPD